MMTIKKEMREKRDACPDKRNQTDESNSTVDVHMKKVISYKEYTAQKEAEKRALAADKSAPDEEEDWDAEPQETPPGASSMVPSQEDEWKQMINQDPCSGLITQDSGHSTMSATGETESIENVKELTVAVGGVNESAAAECLSDVEWRGDDPLFVFSDDHVTKPQTPVTASTPIQACEEEDSKVPSFCLSGRSPACGNLSLHDYQRQFQVTLNLTMMKRNWWDSLDHL